MTSRVDQRLPIAKRLRLLQNTERHRRRLRPGFVGNIGVILIEEVHPLWSIATVYGEAAEDMAPGDWVLLDLSESRTMETPAKEPAKKQDQSKKKETKDTGEPTDFEPPPAF